MSLRNGREILAGFSFMTAEQCLNESPSEKEGKSTRGGDVGCGDCASMKVPPKRKGNQVEYAKKQYEAGLNESPSEKEGKYGRTRQGNSARTGLNESPSEKEGKFWRDHSPLGYRRPQ